MNQITSAQRHNLRLLVRALRSGKYKQGHGQLIQVDSEIDTVSTDREKHLYYCCLGIACVVLNYKPDDIEDETHLGLGDDSRNSFLSKKTAAKFGLSPEQQEELAEMNDSKKTFEEIANKIVEWFNLSPKGR